MFDPAKFIPEKDRVSKVTSYPSPYELAWQESHSGKSLSEAIETVRQRLDVTYDMASSLVWAEISALSPQIPA